MVGLVFLILTASRTGFAAAILALAAYLAAVSSRWAKTALVLGLGIAFCALLLVLGSALLPDLKSAAMLGRDDANADSFNGRTWIWEEVGPYIHQSPILGYGYGGFWNERHINEISAVQKWGVAEGHSAYLDCLLNLGLVGLVVYVLALLAGIRRSFLLHRVFRKSGYAFLGAFLTFCVADGFLESAIGQSVLLMFLIVAILIHLGFRRLVLVQARQDSPSAEPRRFANNRAGVRTKHVHGLLPGWKGSREHDHFDSDADIKRVPLFR